MVTEAMRCHTLYADARSTNEAPLVAPAVSTAQPYTYHTERPSWSSMMTLRPVREYWEQAGMIIPKVHRVVAVHRWRSLIIHHGSWIIRRSNTKGPPVRFQFRSLGSSLRFPFQSGDSENATLLPLNVLVLALQMLCDATRWPLPKDQGKYAFHGMQYARSLPRALW
jgi:hypothetical protein